MISVQALSESPHPMRQCICKHIIWLNCPSQSSNVILYGAADILRREGMDAATYKDFIFGMLFLKRSSDVFLAARDKLIKSEIDSGMPEADAEVNYGENPDYYDEFFVPPVARWPHIQDRLNDASVPFGSVLDQALVGLSQSNRTLEYVLDHTHFMRVQGNKRVVSDDACKDLVRHFSRYRPRSEDFQFSDLLGSAYEFLINMFAESAGKKGFLHAARRHPIDGPHSQPYARPEHLRSDVRLGWSAENTLSSQAATRRTCDPAGR